MKLAFMILAMCMLGLSAASGQSTAPAAGDDEQCPFGGMPVAADGATSRRSGQSMPTSRPACMITIQAIQGTAGGPAVGTDPVIVELFQEDGQPQTVRTLLDPQGKAVLKDIALAGPFRPRVTVQHQGAYFRTLGEVMNDPEPSQNITVTVYEVDQAEPAWQIRMRHVIVRPGPGRLAVMEVLACENPSDRAWLGPPDSSGFRWSVALELPAGVEDVSLEGAFNPCPWKVVNGRLLLGLPLTPGLSQFRLGYVVPTQGSQARIEVVSPAPVRQLGVFVPEGQCAVKAEGLEPGEVMQMQQMSMRSYKAASQPAGQRILVVLSGLPAAEPVEELAHLPQILAAVGGGVILLLCVVLLLRKSKGSRSAS